MEMASKNKQQQGGRDWALERLVPISSDQDEDEVQLRYKDEVSSVSGQRIK